MSLLIKGSSTVTKQKGKYRGQVTSQGLPPSYLSLSQGLAV